MEPTAIDKHPMSLRSLRMDAHLTSKELAERMGRNQSYVSAVELAYSSPRATRLAAYLTAVDRSDLADRVTAAAKVVAHTTGRAVDPSAESLHRYFEATRDDEMATLLYLTLRSSRTARRRRSEH